MRSHTQSTQYMKSTTDYYILLNVTESFIQSINLKMIYSGTKRVMTFILELLANYS